NCSAWVGRWLTRAGRDGPARRPAGFASGGDRRATRAPGRSRWTARHRDPRADDGDAPWARGEGGSPRAHGASLTGRSASVPARALLAGRRRHPAPLSVRTRGRAPEGTTGGPPGRPASGRRVPPPAVRLTVRESRWSSTAPLRGVR